MIMHYSQQVLQILTTNMEIALATFYGFLYSQGQKCAEGLI